MKKLTNEKIFDDEAKQYEFEVIWEELEPKIRARLEIEPDWKNKNYKEIANDIYDMAGQYNDAVGDAILFEALKIFV